MRTPTYAAAVVVAGLVFAPAALAQIEKSVTVRLEHNDADSRIRIGDTITWTLWVEIEGYENVAWIDGVRMIADANADLLHISNIEFDPEPTQIGCGPVCWFTGTALTDGSDFTFLDMDQPNGEVQLGPNPKNPLAIVQYDTTAVAAGFFEYTLDDYEPPTSTTGFVKFMPNAFYGEVFAASDTTILTDTLTIVPAPAASLSLLAALGLASHRRRV